VDKNIIIKGEPQEVTEIRNKILSTFNELIFIEEGHKYFLRGEELESVSHITHIFKEEFDTDLRAENYALKNGETPEYWKDKWRYNSLKATTTGTLVHSFAESMSWVKNGHPELITEDCKCKYIADKNWLIPTRTKEEAVVKFFNDLPKDFHLVLPETKVYSSVNPNLPKFKKNYAGTFDLLMYYKHPKDDSKSGLVIMDWKTNNDIYSDFSRKNNKMMYYPFESMYDESKSAYTLQLSCYQIPLEDIGLKIIGRRLIWLKDDGTYEIVKTENKTKELREYLLNYSGE
jgi:hypothetical protein